MSRPAPTMRSAALALAGWIAIAGTAVAAAPCPVNHDQLTKALKASVKPSGGPGNGGLDNNEWAAAVARDGTVCAIAFSGSKPEDQWPGGRAIAAEKANTANALSLDKMALSTANLYAGAQPGGFLYGLQATNPPAADLLYAGDGASYGSASDPLIGKHPGGIVAFGGGLALYDDHGVVGGLGASGDSSCADHNVAWRIRHQLGLDHVPAGVSPDNNDAIIYDMLPDKTSASGYGHAWCKGTEPQIAEQIHAGVVPHWAKAMK
jgi:Haem-degrading